MKICVRLEVWKTELSVKPESKTDLNDRQKYSLVQQIQKMKVEKLKEKMISEFLQGILPNVGTVMKEVMSKVNHI